MSIQAKLIALVVEQQRALLKLFEESERKADAPAPAPAPPPSRKLRQSERPGIDMRKMGLSVPKPRPPRKPSWER